ncbi:MAG TPA: hypothetical protein VGH38_10075 [Bryobacteraceae bacterium]
MLEITNNNLDWRPAAAKMGALWCDWMHDSPMWPIHGQYECRSCGRRYQVPWAQERVLQAPASKTAAMPLGIPQVRVPSYRLALLPLAIAVTMLLAPSAHAVDAAIVESRSGSSLAFARYIAGLEQPSPWGLETVEIEASLPKLAKTGRLRAIRRILPFGKPQYQVLEIEGDQTVKQQVIARYLNADVRASALPASSVAITPANYKFHYKGAAKIGDTLAYSFLITPRKKREGLIKGELWLDGETGAVLRQSGYLVKRPSIFVKRMDVTRETVLQDGVAEMRLTHWSLEARLFGRAELTIQERPYSDTNPGSVSGPGNEER